MSILHSLAAALILSPVLASAPARADALDLLLSGIWGAETRDDLRCLDNAKRPELLAPDLLRFHYDTGIWFPPGQWTNVLDYRILERGEDWLRMQIPNEYREFDRKPVTWLLRFDGPDRFVWFIDGKPDDTETNPQIRCSVPQPTS